MIATGSKVYLRACAFGEPGTVLSIERRKVVVLWHDLDYLARHSPDSLVLVEAPDARPPSAPAKKKAGCFRLSGRGQHTKGTR